MIVEAEALENRESQGMTLRDYARVLARRWWLIALVAGIAALSAFFFSWAQTSMYQTAATLMYEPPIDVANPLTGTSYDNPTTRLAELSGVVTALSSPDMQARGNKLLREQLGGTPLAAYEVEGELDTSSSGGTSNNSTVSVWGRSSDPTVARVAANAYAKIFILWRKETEKAAISDAIAALSAQMTGYKGAAKQSTEYLVLAQRLQDLQIRKATVTGKFRLAVPAALPGSPYEPKPLRSAILGLAVGLFAGIGLAFLLEQFDTRIHGHHEVARILQRPVIGRVPHFGDGRRGVAQGGDSRVVALTDPDGPPAESFRMLRSNLEFMSLDQEVRSIMVTSSEQGEGKSVAACNLAVSLALAGVRVVLVDGDLRVPRVHEYLGLPNDRGVTSVVTGRHSLQEALQHVDVSVARTAALAAAAGAAPEAARSAADDAGAGEAGPAADAAALADVTGNGEGVPLSVLTRGPRAPNPGEVVASRRFAEMIGGYAGSAELVIVDTPAFLVVGDASAIARTVDGILYVCNPTVVKRPTLEAAAERLAHLPAPLLGAVVVGGHKGRGYSRDYGYYGSSYYYKGGRHSRTAGDEQAGQQA